MLALAASFGLSLIAGSAPAPVVSSSRVASPVMADKKGPARKSIFEGWSILEGLNNPIDATRGSAPPTQLSPAARPEPRPRRGSSPRALARGRPQHHRHAQVGRRAGDAGVCAAWLWLGPAGAPRLAPSPLGQGAAPAPAVVGLRPPPLFPPQGALKKYDTRLQKPKGKGPINKSEVRTFPSKLMPKGRK